MKRLIFLLPVAIFAIIAVGFSIGLTKDPSIIPSQLIDKPLPAFQLGGVRPGEPGFGNATFQGEPKLLNIFASWCVSCRVEHPMLMRLKAEGVPIYGLDWKDKAADGAAFLAEHGDPYVMTANDESGRVGIDLGVTGAPETFVIDASGRVRYKQIGPITPEVWEDTLKPLMDQLRREGARA
jgi:cytochrome c biogenesis protein CcmG/thiol:disulfide interchange protein DsbE